MINRNILQKAAKEGNTSLVKNSINAGCDINTRFVHEWTLLHCAAKGGHAETVLMLLSEKSDVNAVNDIWQTPMDLTESKAVEEILRKAGGKQAVEDSLHAAAFTGNLKWVKKHVLAGSNVNALRQGELPLCLALKRHKPDVVAYLLAQKPDIKKRQPNGETAFHAAAKFDADGLILKAMLNLGAEVNQTDKDGDTAICWAASAGNLPAVDFLLQHGAEVNGRYSQETSPVSEALSNGNYEIAQRLIDAGAKVSLSQAVQSGHISATRRLIQGGADLNETESECSQPPLLRAVCENYFEMVELLLESGADPNVQSSIHHGRESVFGGDTALHWAVYEKSAKMVKLLLAYAADPDVQDAHGLSPLEVAKRRDNSHLVQLMEADLDQKRSKNAVEQLYTISKVTELLSVDEAFVLNLIKAGKLRQLKLDPNTTRIPAGSLARYLASLPK